MGRNRAQKLTRVDATVQGDIQTVGYRYIVQDTARRLGVKGHVQNLPAVEHLSRLVEEFVKTTPNAPPN